MAELLHKLGATRAEVAYVPGAEPDAIARARLHLASEALRPAESTDHWQTFLGGDALAPDGRASLANALDGVRMVVAPTAHDEAEAIALILRSVIETQGKTAALVTPDRVLARRVAARLKRYDLAVDDSAGMPLARTVPGAFLDLVLGAAETDFAPPELMALLKHPLALLGRPAAETRAAARALERGAFRDCLCRTRARRCAGGARSGPHRGQARPTGPDRQRARSRAPSRGRPGSGVCAADRPCRLANTRPRRWPRPMSSRLRLWHATQRAPHQACGRAMPARPCRCCWPS